MLRGNLALLVRILLFSVAGLTAAIPFASFEEATGLLTIDLTGASKYIAGGVWAAIGGGTFWWSRIAKGFGGVT